MSRYGWDGERLVCEDDGERILTVLYEPGRFVPVLRIEQGREAPADEDEAVTQTALDQVARLCAAEGIELPKALRSQAAARISLYVTDHLGTPLRLVRQEGAIEWQARPDDWGAVREQHGIRQPLRFQGQWEDEESGFYYNRYRYYDPRMGRYVTQDPSGFFGGIQKYVYPLNSISNVDPQGLRAEQGDTSVYPPVMNCTCALTCKSQAPSNMVEDMCKLLPDVKIGDVKFGFGVVCETIAKNIECDAKCHNFCSGKTKENPCPEKDEL